MIQGTSSGVGKTILVTALCRIFSNAGYRVAPFKSQNMSNFSYRGNGFEISRAQAIQAIASKTEIIPQMNPILLKPIGDSISSVFVNGKFYKNFHINDYYKKFVLTKGLDIVFESLNELKKNYEFLIIEGAGSPAEINLEKYDIANMKIAEKLNSPVILITDIERGGSFASLVGTLHLLDRNHKKLVKGFVFNKFRGDLNILQSGFRKLRENTDKQVFGVIPMSNFSIPEEDSLGVKSKKISWGRKNIKKIDKEIDKLAKIIESNLNIKAIERLVK